jgi:hypothetical protein
VAKHINSIFTKLDLSPADGDRRVLAVLHFLGAHEQPDQLGKASVKYASRAVADGRSYALTPDKTREF